MHFMGPSVREAERARCKGPALCYGLAQPRRVDRLAAGRTTGRNRNAPSSLMRRRDWWPMALALVRSDILYAWKGPSQLIVSMRGDCDSEHPLSGFYFRE